MINNSLDIFVKIHVLQQIFAICKHSKFAVSVLSCSIACRFCTKLINLGVVHKLRNADWVGGWSAKALLLYSLVWYVIDKIKGIYNRLPLIMSYLLDID